MGSYRALVALVLGGCGGDQPAPSSASVAEDPGLGHVRGLGWETLAEAHEHEDDVADAG